MTTSIKGGHRLSLLYWQRLVLLKEARGLAERLTMAIEQAFLEGLPGAYAFKLQHARHRAVTRQMRRAYDLSTHNSRMAALKRGTRRGK